MFFWEWQVKHLILGKILLYVKYFIFYFVH